MSNLCKKTMNLINPQPRDFHASPVKALNYKLPHAPRITRHFPDPEPPWNSKVCYSWSAPTAQYFRQWAGYCLKEKRAEAPALFDMMVDECYAYLTTGDDQHSPPENYPPILYYRSIYSFAPCYYPIGVKPADRAKVYPIFATVYPQNAERHVIEKVVEDQSRLIKRRLIRQGRELKSRDPNLYGSLIGTLGCFVVSSLAKWIALWVVRNWLDPKSVDSAQWYRNLYRSTQARYT